MNDSYSDNDNPPGWNDPPKPARDNYRDAFEDWWEQCWYRSPGGGWTHYEHGTPEYYVRYVAFTAGWFAHARSVEEFKE